MMRPRWLGPSGLRNVTPRPNLNEQNWRFNLLWGLVALIFGSIIARAFWLQVLDQSFLQAKGDGLVMRVDTVRAYRGIIRDRNGIPLAVSTPMVTLWMDPKEFLEAKKEHETILQALKEKPNSKSLKYKLGKNNFDLNELALAIGMEPKELVQKIMDKPNFRFLILKKQMPPDSAQVVLDRKFQSVGRKIEYQRYYPQAQPNAQIIGIMGTKKDPDGENEHTVGVEGIERQFDGELAGQDGKLRVMHDKQGNVIKEVELIAPAKPGKDLNLSIDSRLQYVMYRELAAGGIANNARSATAVALNARTGEILAMCSWPSFNPNDSKNGLTNKDAMRNRAVVDMFEPGSTMKPMTLSAALESGKYTPHSTVNTSPGTLKVGSHIIHDHGNLGTIDLKTIIVKSSNVGAAKVALSLPTKTVPLFDKRMGFGQRSALHFPGESPGYILPSNLWNEAEVATMAYGYGINATAIQLAQAYGVLAAEGNFYPPTLLKRDTVPAGQPLLSPKIAHDIIGMMEGVTVKGGTAPQAAIPGYRVAGKTGTAHKLRSDGKGYSETEYRALFVGMAPASHPEIVLAVVVENPVGQYYGGLVAAPIFAKIMQESLRLRNIPLDKPLKPEAHGKKS